MQITLTTLTTLKAEWASRADAGTLMAPVAYHLAAQLRHHHITIRQLAAHLDITLKTIRGWRAAGQMSYLDAISVQEAIEQMAARRTTPAQVLAQAFRRQERGDTLVIRRRVQMDVAALRAAGATDVDTWPNGLGLNIGPAVEVCYCPGGRPSVRFCSDLATVAEWEGRVAC